MVVKYICPYWGQDGIGGAAFIDKALEAGYDGVEVNVPADKAFEKELLNAIKTTQCAFIAQQWLPLQAETVEAYIIRFSERLQYLAALNPVFINSHTGKDYFSFEDNCKVIEKAFKIEQETGIRIIHETHRGRFNYSAFSTKTYLNKYPQLRLNADFSHWCNVSESFLEDQQPALALAMSHSYYLHARIGHTQSAQVNDPFAPEWKEALNTFVAWWKEILTKAEQRGAKEFYICPEFGPYPYMPYQPYTNIPIQNQWLLNVKMAQYLKQVL